jgi:hypothetical protein
MKASSPISHLFKAQLLPARGALSYCGLGYTDLHMKVPILAPDYTASVIDICISHLESAEFMHLRISAPVDSQAKIGAFKCGYSHFASFNEQSGNKIGTFVCNAV